jgi:hypothetical protein
MEEEKPKSGSAIERAKEYGIDLTITQANLRKTPLERLEQLQAMANLVFQVRENTIPDQPNQNKQ